MRSPRVPPPTCNDFCVHFSRHRAQCDLWKGHSVSCEGDWDDGRTRLGAQPQRRPITAQSQTCPKQHCDCHIAKESHAARGTTLRTPSCRTQSVDSSPSGLNCRYPIHTSQHLHGHLNRLRNLYNIISTSVGHPYFAPHSTDGRPVNMSPVARPRAELQLNTITTCDDRRISSGVIA